MLNEGIVLLLMVDEIGVPGPLLLALFNFNPSMDK